MARSRVSVMILLLVSLAVPLQVAETRAATWSSEVPIITRPGDDWQPSLIRLKVGAQAGYQAIAWASDRAGTFDIYFLINKGNGWQAPTGVNSTGWIGDGMGGLWPTYADLYPSLVELANGDVMIIWAQCPPPPAQYCNIVYNTYTFRPTTSYWIEFVDLADGSVDGIFNTGPSLVRTPGGLLCAFWHSDRLASLSDTTNDYDVYYTCSPDNGLNWDLDTRMPGSVDSVDDDFPSATSSSDGTIWLAWNSYHDSRVCCPSLDSEIYMASFKNGVWSSALQMTTDNGGDTAPVLTFTKDGGLWLFWESNRDSGGGGCTNINIYSKRSYDPLSQTSWSSDLGLTSDPCKDLRPAAAEVQTGVIGVVWSSNRDAATYPYDIFYATLSFHNLQVVSITPVPTSVQPGGIVTVNVVVGNRGGYPETFSLALSANGTSLTTIPASCPASTDCNIPYSWDTAGKTPGRYIIHATVAPVASEENTGDNSNDSGPVTIGNRDIRVPGPIIIPAYIYRGQTIKVNVTVTNSGQVTEDFTLTLTYNDTRTIGTATASGLAPGSSKTLTITWNTSTYYPGGCKLTATLPILPTEKNTADNTYSQTYSYASCLRKTGDVTGDNSVSLDDLIATYLHMFTTDPNSIPVYDIDGDRAVDINDLILVYLNQFM